MKNDPFFQSDAAGIRDDGPSSFLDECLAASRRRDTEQAACAPAAVTNAGRAENDHEDATRENGEINPAAGNGLIDGLQAAGMLHPDGTIETKADGRRIWRHPEAAPAEDHDRAESWPPSLAPLVDWFMANRFEISQQTPFRAGRVSGVQPHRLVIRLTAEIAEGPFAGMRADDLREELSNLRDYFTRERGWR